MNPKLVIDDRADSHFNRTRRYDTKPEPGRCEVFEIFRIGKERKILGQWFRTILDVSNRADPRSVGSYSTGGVSNDVLVRGNFAYLATHRGLEILDVSTPSQIRRLSTAATPEDAYKRIGLIGNLAYVPVGRWSGAWTGLQIFDVGDSADPVLVGSYALPNSGGQVLHDAAYDSDGNVYIAADNYGLYILRYTGSVLAARSDWWLYK